MGRRKRSDDDADGLPARARVVVNQSSGQGTGEASLRTNARLKLQVLPDGETVKHTQLLPAHQVELLTAGMEIPVLIDPASGTVRSLGDGLDEAIGRYYQKLEPAEFDTWEAALTAKRKQLRRSGGLLGDARFLLDQARDATASAKELPGGVRSFGKEWRDTLGGVREELTRPDGDEQAEAADRRRIRAAGKLVSARVLAREDTGEMSGGATVWRMRLELKDGDETWIVEHSEALHDTWPPSLQIGQRDSIFVDPEDRSRVVPAIHHGVNS